MYILVLVILIKKVMIMGQMEYVNFQDKLYSIYRRLRAHDVKENGIQPLKEVWFCDIVIKNKTPDQSEEYLYFLREIPEAIIVEDEPIVITEASVTT